LSELFLFSATRAMPWRRIALYTAGIIALASWIEWRFAPAQPRFPEDGHAVASLNVAFSAATCRNGASISYKYQPGRFLAANPQATTRPVREIVTSLAGSVEEFCSSTAPYLNEDNSLSLLETMAIAARPDISADAIADTLSFGKLVVLALVCASLLRLGASVSLAAACTVVAVGVLRLMIDEGMAYSIHSFFFVLILLNTALCAWAAKFAADRSRWFAPMAALAGFVAAFSVNMRASYLPIYVSCACLCAAAAWLRGVRRPAVLALLAFAAGYLLFQYPFIVRRIPDTDYNHTFHSVSHPLVLGLALPPSDLAAREGIRWNDADGIVIARRIDPNAKYLGPGYDHALLTYYRSLWRRYPAEMLGVYAAKLKMAGADMIQNRYLISDVVVRRGLLPLRWVSDGRILLLLYLAGALIGFWAYVRHAVDFGLWVCLLLVAGAMLYFEAALILPGYYLAYQSALLVVTVFWSFIAIQLCVNAAVAAGRAGLAKATS
jgi:hypothetical protein